MITKNTVRFVLCFVALAFFVIVSGSFAEEKLTVSYSSVDAPSANWYIAQEKGLYKKYGMDVESIFIPASSTNVAVLVAGQLKFGNGTGGTIASAAVSGANLVAVACFMNTLPYELIVQESIKTKEQLQWQKHRHQPHRQLVGRDRAGISQTSRIGAGQRRGDHTSGRLGRTGCGFPHRQDRRFPRALQEFFILRKACRNGFW